MGKERAQPFNCYDAMFDGLHNTGNWSQDPGLLGSGCTRMFGNHFIGMQELTNLQVPGMLAYDGDAWILNWYARTNIPECSELDDWAHSAMITLQVGWHNAMQLTLFDLLRGQQGYVTPLEVTEEYKAENERSVRESVARRALAAFESAGGHKRGLFDLSDVDRQAWLAVGAEMWKLFEGPRIIVVPVRQNMSVSVSGSPSTLEALRDHVRDFGEGVDAIMPRARIWIHVEGVSFREEQ